MSIVIGIDYSVNCPAICVIENDQPKWFVNYRKIDGNSYPSLGPNIQLTRSKTEDSLSRCIELRDWATEIIVCNLPTMIVIEDYSFNAKGNITLLAENTGILKAGLRSHFPSIPTHLVAPTAMKKFATTKGNADKDMIWDSFMKALPQYTHLPQMCHPKAKKVGSPCNDIADAYYLAQYGRSVFLPAI